MNYELQLTNTAQREMKRLPKNVQRQVTHALDLIEKEPRIADALRWHLKGYWSYHTGSFVSYMKLMNGIKLSESSISSIGKMSTEFCKDLKSD